MSSSWFWLLERNLVCKKENCKEVNENPYKLLYLYK